jgi:acyl-coenzyme A thioesterase PaaI-like protein
MSRRFPSWWLKLRVNAWPPFIGAGIRIRRIDSGFREILVEMPLTWYNRGYHGTHFGGSLFAMCDPFFALMVLHNLPPDYVVWDKAASIDFVAPGRSRVSATFRLGDEDLAAIRRMTEDGARHLHVFRTNVVDDEGLAVARVEKIVYVRRRRSDA